MRATYLGSNPLTALLRCTCGRRLFFDKKTWADRGFLGCDKCAGVICYFSMRVIPATQWRMLMNTQNDFSVEEIAEFGDVFADVDQAKASLELAAQKLARRGYPERAHKILGAAQVADAQKYLLIQDWEQKKKQAA